MISLPGVTQLLVPWWGCAHMRSSHLDAMETPICGKIPKLYFDDFPIELNLRLTTGGYIPLPSGKRLHNELENHHAIHGKIHYKW